MNTINTSYDMRSQEYTFLRRHGLRVGACLLVYFLLQNVFVVLLRLFGVLSDFYGNAAFQYAASAVFVTVGCLGVPFFLMSCRKGSPSYRRALPFNFPEDKSKAFYLICAGFAFCLASNYIAVYYFCITKFMSRYERGFYILSVGESSLVSKSKDDRR